MFQYTCVATVVTALFCAVYAIPSFSIYNNNTMETTTFGMQLWADRPDLASTAKYFPNTTNSYFCVTGIWALHYQVENYGTGPTWSAPDIWRDLCGAFYPEVWVGSARIVGEVGEQRLNLYLGVNFKHNASIVTTSQPSVSTNFESMILVGNASVQLYIQPNYGGSSYCLPAQGHSFNYLFNIASIGLEAGDIRSVRFGCASDANIIEVQAEESVQVQPLVGIN